MGGGSQNSIKKCEIHITSLGKTHWFIILEKMIGEPQAELTSNWLHLMPHLFIFQHDYHWTEYSFAYYLPPPLIIAQSEWTQWRDTNSVTFNQERTLFSIMNWINTCISYFQNKTSAPSPSNRLRRFVYFLNQLGKRRAGSDRGIFFGGEQTLFSQFPASGMLCGALWQQFLEAQREATALTTGGVPLWDRGGPQAPLQGFASRIRMVWKLRKWQEKYTRGREKEKKNRFRHE